METKRPKRHKLSRISYLHYLKLVFRSVLFLAALVIYIWHRHLNMGGLVETLEEIPVILPIIWLIFVLEMFLRFFPSNLESMGCQKQFTRNYRPAKAAEEGPAHLDSWKSTLAVTLAWLALNGLIGVLYYAKIIDAGILLLISLAYSVCDMICILFFCPFQTWFMKNKCCGTCRIYNWDYAMMFTPLVFIKSVYSWSILAFALALLLRWEVAVHCHPEYFLERTNMSLACANCQEKLCHHKKQLRRFWRTQKAFIRKEIGRD